MWDAQACSTMWAPALCPTWLWDVVQGSATGGGVGVLLLFCGAGSQGRSSKGWDVPPPPWVDRGLEFWRSPPIVCACPSHAGRDGAPCFSTGSSGVQWLLRVLRAVVVASCSRRGQLRRGERFHGHFWTVSKKSKPGLFSDGLPDSRGKKLFEAFSVLLLVYLLCLNESVWDNRRQCSQVSDSCVCAGSTLLGEQKLPTQSRNPWETFLQCEPRLWVTMEDYKHSGSCKRLNFSLSAIGGGKWSDFDRRDVVYRRV